MNVLDVNVVLALFRADHPHHRAATAWWEESLARSEPFTVPDIVWHGFARMTTNHRMFGVPATFDQAWTFARAVIAQPQHLAFTTHPRTLEEFARLATAADARGDLVTDAYIAACAAAYGGTVVTFDRDFRRFDGLRVTELG
jgi:toxin-antitoxin system PIN domain toxin